MQCRLWMHTRWSLQRPPTHLQERRAVGRRLQLQGTAGHGVQDLQRGCGRTQAGWGKGIGHGVRYLRLMSYAQPFMMLEGIGAGFFNGIAMTKIPSTTGIAGNLLRIPLAAALTGLWAEIGIWWTLNISDFFKGSVLALLALWWLPKIEALVRKRASKDSKQPAAVLDA